MTETIEKRRGFVFGDIHGCAHALDILFDRMAPTSDDLVVILGDAIDRGPDSRAVLDLLIEIQKTCELVYVLGNHEEMMVDVLHGRNPDEWMHHGGKATLASYKWHLKHVPEAHLELLDSTVQYWEGSAEICVHANLEPGVSLDRQRSIWLRWQKLSGRELPHSSGKRVICGHSGVSYSVPTVRDGWVCLDTLAHSGGYLTALELGSGEIFQSRQTGDFRCGVFLHELEA